MTTWIRRARAALAMGFTWALGWGFIGGMIELLSNLAPGLQWPYAVDMWPQTLAIPGFLCGAVFGLVLSFAASRRSFDDLSVPGFAGLGAIAGGALGIVTGAPVFILAPLTFMSAASAASTLAVARRARRLPAPAESE
jgi:hypothetical protein